jgi:hypothetical protein
MVNPERAGNVTLFSGKITNSRHQIPDKSQIPNPNILKGRDLF